MRDVGFVKYVINARIYLKPLKFTAAWRISEIDVAHGIARDMYGSVVAGTRRVFRGKINKIIAHKRIDSIYRILGIKGVFVALVAVADDI